jgi:hypothetical protein
VTRPTVVCKGLSSPESKSGQAVEKPCAHTKILSGPAKKDDISPSKPQDFGHNDITTTTVATSVNGPAPTETRQLHSEVHRVARPSTSTSDATVGTTTCSDPQHRGQALLCGLLHRKDFEVKRIRKKLLIDNKVMFVIRWKSTWVPAKLIIEGNDVEYPYVAADGTRWYIKKTLGHREVGGTEQVKARWVNTQEPLEMLSNAQEAIALFESKPRIAGSDGAAKIRQRKVLTILGSNFPHGSVLPQSEVDYAACQRWVASTWPVIRPHRTLDLYPAIYRIHMELAALKRGNGTCGKSYRWLMDLPQLRHLHWHQDYLDSGKLFLCRRRRRASLFIQVTGVHDLSCTRCHGEKVHPFIGCVRTAPDQQLWLNGACANCGTQDNGSCDCHRKDKGPAGKSLPHTACC